MGSQINIVKYAPTDGRGDLCWAPVITKIVTRIVFPRIPPFRHVTQRVIDPLSDSYSLLDYSRPHLGIGRKFTIQGGQQIGIWLNVALGVFIARKVAFPVASSLLNIRDQLIS